MLSNVKLSVEGQTSINRRLTTLEEDDQRFFVTNSRVSKICAYRILLSLHSYRIGYLFSCSSFLHQFLIYFHFCSNLMLMGGRMLTSVQVSINLQNLDSLYSRFFSFIPEWGWAFTCRGIFATHLQWTVCCPSSKIVYGGDSWIAIFITAFFDGR